MPDWLVKSRRALVLDSCVHVSQIARVFLSVLHSLDPTFKTGLFEAGNNGTELWNIEHKHVVPAPELINHNFAACSFFACSTSTLRSTFPAVLFGIASTKHTPPLSLLYGATFFSNHCEISFSSSGPLV